jgi:hypothetical protein
MYIYVYIYIYIDKYMDGHAALFLESGFESRGNEESAFKAAIGLKLSGCRRTWKVVDTGLDPYFQDFQAEILGNMTLFARSAVSLPNQRDR